MDIRAVVSVLGKDRKGIVATVAATLAEFDVNIVDIRQTLLGDDIFSMTMLVTLADGVEHFDQVQNALAQDAEKLHVRITIQREDVFRYMYEV